MEKKCPICGGEKKSVFIPLCGECYPPMHKKGSFPHQKLRKRKIWKEKRLQKLNEVGNKCECCEKPKQSLSIHHPKEINWHTYQRIWDVLLEERLNLFLNEDNNRLLYANVYLQYKYKKRVLNSIDKRINRDKKVGLDNINSTNKIGKIVYVGFIQKIIPIFYENLKVLYEKEEKKLITSYLNFDKVRVLCKGCHIATSRGLTLCKICKDGFHTDYYDRCSKCREKFAEDNKHTSKLVRKLFNISLWELNDMSEQSQCLKCGDYTFEQIHQYIVYLSQQDLSSEESIGDLCEACFLEYKNIEKKEYYVIEVNDFKKE